MTTKLYGCEKDRPKDSGRRNDWDTWGEGQQEIKEDFWEEGTLELGCEGCSLTRRKRVFLPQETNPKDL